MLHKGPTPQTNGQWLEEVRPRKKNPTYQTVVTNSDTNAVMSSTLIWEFIGTDLLLEAASCSL